jgi:hypothetical protein
MIGMGIASSHAPVMFCPAEVWPRIYANIPEYMKNSQPHTAKLETRDVIDSYIRRINAALDVLARAIADYRPDAIVCVGDDQEDMFDRSNSPAIAVFTGEEVWGSAAPFYMNEPPEKSRVHIPVHAPLARHLMSGLVKRGFDPAQCAEVKPQGPAPDRGVSHMLVTTIPRLVPKLDIPVIPVFLNAYFPPQPTGRRCWDLGVAIADIFKDRPERLAIYGSGGMSHDPIGPRAGWIDEPLDNWVFERIEQNRGEELCNLFTFDSATLRGGTGELRAWIAAAGACRWPGKRIEYIPIHHGKCGIGFALWPPKTT